MNTEQSRYGQECDELKHDINKNTNKIQSKITKY